MKNTNQTNDNCERLKNYECDGQQTFEDIGIKITTDDDNNEDKDKFTVDT